MGEGVITAEAERVVLPPVGARLAELVCVDDDTGLSTTCEADTEAVAVGSEGAAVPELLVLAVLLSDSAHVAASDSDKVGEAVGDSDAVSEV